MEMKRRSPAARLLALLLCLAMVLPMIPQAVGAAATDSSGNTLLADGVVSTGGSFSGSSVVTGNKVISLDRVTSDADEVSGTMLYHHDRYAIMNVKYGHLMSYDPIATTQGMANLATSIKQDQNKSAPHTYYVDASNPNKIHIDHSDRDNALWVLRAFGGGDAHYTRSITVGNRGTGLTTYGRHMQANGVEGFEFFKGRFGADNANNTSHGYYWSTPVAASGTATNESAADNQKYYTHLNVRSNNNPFVNDYLWQNQLKDASDKFKIETIHFDSPTDPSNRVEFLIYFKMADNDYRFLYCDEFGNWGVRRYYDPASGVLDTGAYYPMSQITQDLDMLVMYLYHYNDSGSTSKRVQISGSSNYTVARGINQKEMLEGIAKGLTVTDASTKQQVVFSGSTAEPGCYWLDLSSGGFNANKAGTYSVPVKYRNDTAANASNANTTIGTVSITVATMTASQTSGLVGYVSRNSMFSDKVYIKDKEGNYVVLTGSLGGVTVPISVKMLWDGNQHFDSTIVGTQTGISVKYSGSVVIASMTVVVSDTTIEPHLPVYPEPGSVAVFKGSTTTSQSFANTGEANIQLSATGMPIKNGIDLLIMIDLSSSMRWNLHDDGETPPYYTKGYVLNNSWNMDVYKDSRLFAMEESLKTMINAMKAADVDVRIAISDFGDIDHYQVGGGVNNAQGGSILVSDADRNYGHWAYLDNDGDLITNEGWNRSVEIGNHLNYVFGGNDVYGGESGNPSGTYHIYHWKYWSQDALSSKYPNMDTVMMGDIPTKVYTGSFGYNADAFMNVHTMADGAINSIITNLRIQNSFMLGTNYDVGLETAYQLAHARREQNIRDGEDREIVCVFMSDGAAMQFNYFSGHSGSYAWRDWLLGETDSILTSSTIDLNGDNPRFEMPTLGSGIVDMSRIGEMHPDLQTIIQALGLQNRSMTWAELFSNIRHSSVRVTVPSDGRTYSGAQLMVNLRKQLAKTKKYWDLPHADYLNGGADFQATVNSYYQTYSPFWYFYNAEGKNWWAEAIKGEVGELYPVINKYAHQSQETAEQKAYFNNLGRGGAFTNDGSSPFPYNGDVEHNFVGTNYGNNTAGLALEGQNYISGYDGLGLKLYTIGFALTDDKVLTAQVQNTVLSHIATGPAYCKMATDQASLTAAMNEVIESVTLGSTLAYYTDTLGEAYELADGRTVRVMKKEYRKNEDGSYALNSSGQKIELSSQTLKTIQISSVANKVATCNGKDIWNNTTNIIDDGDLLIFNNNRAGENKDLNGDGVYNLADGDIVDGHYKIDMTGDGVRDYALAPQTFFWRIGNMPQYEIVLDYWIYLTGSLEGELKNGTHNYDTNQSAPLNYVDFRSNHVSQQTQTPVFPWTQDTYTKYTFYLTATTEDGKVKTDAEGNVIYLKERTSGGVTTYTETTDLSQAKTFTVKQKTIPGVGETTLVASDLWSSMSSSDRSKYELVNPSAAVIIESADDKQDHDLYTDDYLPGDSSTTLIRQGNGTPDIYADNLTNSELEDTTLYFGVRVTTSRTYLQYQNYLVNEKGEPIDANGKKTTIDQAVKVGDKKTHWVNVQIGQTNVVTTMTASNAFTNGGLTGSDYEIYNKSGSYSVTTPSYGSTHMLTVNGTTTLATGGKPGAALTDAQLEGTTVYFPVKLKTEESGIRYGHYLVDENGNPIDANGNITTVANAVKVGGLVPQSITTASGQGEVTTSMTAPDAFLGANVNGGNVKYDIYDENGKYVITSEYGAKHNLNVSGDAVVTTGHNEGKLTGEELGETIVYFPVKRQTKENQITYGNYLVNEKGKPIDINGNEVNSIEEAAKIGDLKTQDIFTESGKGSVTTTMTAEEAFENGNVDSNIYEVYEGGTHYDIISEFGKDHNLIIDGDKVLPSGGEAGPLTDEELSDTTVYFPVKIKTEKTKIQYGNYLVNDKGQPVDINGKVVDSIEEAAKVGKMTDQTITTLSGQGQKTTSMTAAKAFTNGGLSEETYQIFEKGAKYTITSEYGELHYLDIPYDYTLVEDGKLGYQTSAELAGTKIYFPVVLKASTSTIQYGNYLVNEEGKPIDINGNVVDSIEEAAKVGDLNSKDITVVGGQGKVTTSVTAGEAFTDNNLDDDIYEIYDGDGKFVIDSQYGEKHQLEVDGDKTLVQDGEPGDLTDEELSDAIIYFPVKIKTEKSSIQYHNYLVNGQGKPIDENGNVVSIQDAVKVGNVKVQDLVSLSGQGPATQTMNAQTAYHNGGLDGSPYQIYDEDAKYTVVSEYGKDYILTVDGSATLYTGGNPGQLTGDAIAGVTVYFPVMKMGKAIKDQVIIDFGLPVTIDVLSNDTALGSRSIVLGISAKDYDIKQLSTGTNPNAYKDTYNFGSFATDTKGTITLVGDKIRYTPTTMSWETYETFTYVVRENVDGVITYHYGAVEVLPATTIYFDDSNDGENSLITFETFTNKVKDEESDWKWAGYVENAEQKEDRPGFADHNRYGFDHSYEEMGANYSLGGSRKVTVYKDHYATASFKFWGTGFDVISMTSNTTGTIVVSVKNAKGETLMNKLVDTYYGYTYVDGQWVESKDAQNALYQVPVMKINGLEYGNYTVTITASYIPFSDHTTADGYDFYLDAIRIYDPANDGNDEEVIKDAYLADGEGWPEYFELRNQIISTGNLDYGNTSTTVNGIVFIDRQDETHTLSVSDYTNFGPNSELYLAAGQSIAFHLNVEDDTLAKIHLAMKSVGGDATVKYFRMDRPVDVTQMTLETATDLYYDITNLNGGVVVIANAGETGIVSITNIKVTYTEKHKDSIEAGFFDSMRIFDMVEDLGDILSGGTNDDSVATEGTPKMLGASLSLRDEIHVNFYFESNKITTSNGRATNAGLLLWYSRLKTDVDEDGNITKVYNTYNDAETVIAGALQDGNKFVVQTPGIAPKKLGDTIYARVYVQDENGNYLYSDVKAYSPRTYAYNMLNSESVTDTGLKSLLVAMLNYATAAQEYFVYNVDIWMPRINGDLTVEQKKMVHAYNEATMVNKTVGLVGEIPGYTHEGFETPVPSVSFDGALSINYYFKPTNTVKGNVSFYYWTADDYDTSKDNLALYTATGKVTMVNASGATEYRVNVTDIAAKDITDNIYVAAVYSDGRDTYCTGVYAYSISYYCKSMTSHQLAKTVKLAEATAVYGYYAKAYFG